MSDPKQSKPLRDMSPEEYAAARAAAVRGISAAEAQDLARRRAADNAGKKAAEMTSDEYAAAKRKLIHGR